MLAAPPAAQGLPFIPSMALGVFIAAPLVTFCLSAVTQAPNPLTSPDAAAWCGMASGALWQAGNACSIVAVQDPRVGLAVSLWQAPMTALLPSGITNSAVHPAHRCTADSQLIGSIGCLPLCISFRQQLMASLFALAQVAYPIMQCALFFSGAWGILLFKELRGRWQALYWTSGAVLLTGAALLSASK